MTEAGDNGLITGAETLWEIVVRVWQTSFAGYNVGDGLIAIGVLALAFMVRGLFSHVVLRRLIAFSERTDNKLDGKLIAALKGPVKLIPVIIGVYIAFTILDLHADSAPVDGTQVVETLVIIALFWALHNAIMPLSHLMTPLRDALTPVMVDWLAKFLRVLFIVIGAAAALQIWGIPVAPVLGGLGLLGVAIGLGAQDLFRNLIAGILILTEKRFVPGEWIQVDGVVEGTVVQINFRSTLIRRFDRSPVFVPNSKLADNAVTNFTRMTHRRIRWIIGVEYKTTTAQLQYIRDQVLDFILTHPEFAKPPEVATFMRVDSFGPSSIDYLLYCFTHTTNWGEWLRLKEELAFAVKRIVEEAGTGFAFPSTSIYMDDGAEVFVPPAVRQHAGEALQAPQADAIARGEDGGGDGGGR
ncbi:mechanosensitive ion channel family protein [Alkalicaulis satelles]|uniref:Mechanosensitive ion channel family protein n=1 Tax=Alkalicaulis satelles TaxID=2609175 RepID=A0A5M6ZCT7_9PROT|nr:mechanosensitive ion channel family protein [Alkalicaulis satelles]KAA5801714.1 mechanosensitive ion channel family protein [Alkalicaulis satelles]